MLHGAGTRGRRPRRLAVHGAMCCAAFRGTAWQHNAAVHTYCLSAMHACDQTSNTCVQPRPKWTRHSVPHRPPPPGRGLNLLLTLGAAHGTAPLAAEVPRPLPGSWACIQSTQRWQAGVDAPRLPPGRAARGSGACRWLRVQGGGVGAESWRAGASMRRRRWSHGIALSVSSIGRASMLVLQHFKRPVAPDGTSAQTHMQEYYTGEPATLVRGPLPNQPRYCAAEGTSGDCQRTGSSTHLGAIPTGSGVPAALRSSHAPRSHALALRPVPAGDG